MSVAHHRGGGRYNMEPPNLPSFFKLVSKQKHDLIYTHDACSDSREIILSASTQQKVHRGVAAMHSPSQFHLRVQRFTVLVGREIQTLTLQSEYGSEF